MNDRFTMDGRELFAQLADKVARGELLITHFVANMQPEPYRRYDVAMRGEMFTTQSPRAKIDMKINAVENPSGMPKRAEIMMAPQVRELIFDEEPRAIYDEDLS